MAAREKPDAPYCGICRCALDIFMSDDGYVRYQHARRAGSVDHLPMPVPFSELKNPRMFCDFCSAPEPSWMYECDVYTLPDMSMSTFDGHWAACESCADLIERLEVRLLVQKVAITLGGIAGAGPSPVKEQLRTLYTHIFKTMKGRWPI